jgi:putative transposase
MKKSKFTENQIVKILGEQEQGKSIADICREHDISQPTFYGWKSKVGGIRVHQLKRIKELEAVLAQ